jgi:5-methylcytosine-specific restriction endonuclease McrA
MRGFLRRWREDEPARRNRSTGDTCFYCSVRFGDAVADHDDTARTVDHRLARSRGGSDRLVNLVFACRACNHRKASSSETEFLASEWLRRRRGDPGA